MIKNTLKVAVEFMTPRSPCSARVELAHLEHKRGAKQPLLQVGCYVAMELSLGPTEKCQP